MKKGIIEEIEVEMKFFLDIDGVMVHANPHRSVELEEDGFYKFNAVAVQVLKSVVFTTKDELILSTSHRFRFNLKQWHTIFKTRGLSVNKISIINLPLDIRTNRKAEILTWINEKCLQPNEIVIIDDDKSLNDLPFKLKERLVLTNSYVGLNYETDLYRIVDRPLKKILTHPIV